MTDIFLNPGEPGTRYTLREVEEIHARTDGRLSFAGLTAISGSLSGAGVATSKSVSAELRQLKLQTNMANGFTLSGVRFKRGAIDYAVKATGEVQTDLSPVTGNGTTVGALAAAQGALTLDAWTTGGPSKITDWHGVAGAPINGANTPFGTYMVTFRTAVAPLRVGSFSLLGTMRDGTTFNVRADENGVIDAPRIKGRFNYETGVASIVGVTPTAPAGQVKSDLSFLEVPGLGLAFVDLIRQETLRYNVTAYTYLPLNAELLGVDPVRLPSDGRVPIFKSGELAVVSHAATTAPVNVVAGSVINAGRERLSRVVLLGGDGKAITSGYAEDLEAGRVTITDPTGYAQPVRVTHRIEDMALMRDAGIDGAITFTRPLTHDFPIGSNVSSCVRSADLRARVSRVFDQASWDRVTFAEAVVGDAAPGTYNATQYPIEVTNKGAITERWALHFKSSTTFDVIGEHVGNVGSGTTLADLAIVNPGTGVPYFVMRALGMGQGWASGNLLRVDTVGAMFGIWMIRTIQQGPEAGDDYGFLTIVRGDVDNPAI
jgi:hypothetical protein